MASFARKQAPRPRKKPRTASQLQQRINVLENRIDGLELRKLKRQLARKQKRGTKAG